jgi:phosphoserine phosphatase
MKELFNEDLVFKFEKNSIVFFDLCDTLYYSNTTFDFLDFYFKDNSRYWFVRGLMNIKLVKIINKLINKVFKIDLFRLIVVLFLRKKDVQDVKIKAKLFVNQLDDKKIHISHVILQKALNANCKVYLVSASLDVVVEQFYNRLNFNKYFATSLGKNKNGTVFNGLFMNDLLGNKKEIIENLIRPETKSYFITDNKSDYNCKDLVDYFTVISNNRNLNYWKKKNQIYEIYEV